jgi:RimJ/RimL family protein N-acetyltransferase
MEVALLTERLELRPLSPAAGALLLRGREKAAAVLGAEIPSEWPDPDLVWLLARHAELTPEAAVWSIWPIIDREARTVVGDFTFLGPPSEEGKVGIAYFIVSSYRRQGYATEAASALAAWAQQQPGVHFLAAACAEENEASIRTLRRVGFRQIDRGAGELRWRMSHPDSDRG